ncbi:hypothetical protein ACOMHN_046956 [Nucella lapillus]
MTSDYNVGHYHGCCLIFTSWNEALMCVGLYRRSNHWANSAAPGTWAPLPAPTVFLPHGAMAPGPGRSLFSPQGDLIPVRLSLDTPGLEPRAETVLSVVLNHRPTAG